MDTNTFGFKQDPSDIFSHDIHKLCNIGHLKFNFFFKLSKKKHYCNAVLPKAKAQLGYECKIREVSL